MIPSPNDIVLTADDDADTITVALLNAPSQLTAALDNVETVLAMTLTGDARRPPIGDTLDAATLRIAGLRATV